MAPTRRSTSRGPAGRPKPDAPDAPVEPALPEKAVAPEKPVAPPKRAARPKPAPRPKPVAPEQPAVDPAPAEESVPAELAPPPRRRRVFVTGGAGFVGRAVIARLLERGDHVVAAVRDPDRVRDLADEGVEVTRNDLSSVARIAEEMHDADAAIHVAGSYRIGIPKDERGAMWDANVGTTTRFLDAAEAARVPRIVYVSTVNVFGNTRGRVVDETFRRDLADGFVSWYDETKYGAHEVAEQRRAAGAPIVIVLPSQVYGPRDHSSFGDQLRRASAGRLRYRALDDVGVGLVHVDDLAEGIVAALDRGRVGESYVLSGPATRLRDALALAAAATGRRAPRLRVPTRVLRAVSPAGALIGQPNLRELISSSAGVTYWASSAKAADELGFRARDLETGLRDTFGRRDGSV